ncbi:hypothetical protein PHISCL_06725 [Aspergillus sclerotialis]|uniref:Uncharacterized protein n=1 Tax=Aspergillus sclerotialis TaxID=2070753 RepID=A0A3A2ZCQ4_9EURO|nr:hypothetical protein PHISCL_06725 [Aspergillus sclerotialis]
MWGKGHTGRGRRPVIGNPTLVTKTLDDSVYQSLSPINSPGAGSSSKPSPPLSSGNRASPITANPSDPDSRFASSNSSRDGNAQFGQFSNNWSQQLHSEQCSADRKPDSPVWREITDVSPPDSPISMSGANGSQESHQVSPIEDEPRSSSRNMEIGSQFPMMRNVPQEDVSSQPTNPKPRKHSLNFSRATRWDDFSGEPTTSETGKTAQAAPGRAPLQSRTAHKQGGSQSSGIFGWGKDQFHPMKKFAEARSRFTKHDDTQPHAMREPGKGTSGRPPMINPIQEKQRSRVSSRAGTSKTDQAKENQEPPAVGLGLRSSVATTFTAGKSMSTTTESRPTTKPDNRHPQPTAYSVPVSQESSTPPRVDLPKSTLDSTLNSALVDLKLEEQPVSRFSSTTYESTEFDSAAESPRDSVAETQSTDNNPSIMSRKRPVPSGIVSGKKPVRKPTPAQVPEESTAKPLPECPPEKQAESRIEALEARRETLARRKGNIGTIIHELTQVIQPSSIAYDMAARDEVKRTVSSLNNELADINREDHEIGLRLFRAYKKRDEQDCRAGSTSLWVKRVTS